MRHNTRRRDQAHSRLARREPSVYGSMLPAMASETTTLDAALAERERVLRILQEAAPRLQARGITRLSLFGSIARGKARPASDVDLLIEVEPTGRFGLSDLLDLQEELSEQLGRTINFAFASEMRPWLREWIEDDRIGVF
jgi:predicted nucleotidyltransferase